MTSFAHRLVGGLEVKARRRRARMFVQTRAEIDLLRDIGRRRGTRR